MEPRHSVLRPSARNGFSARIIFPALWLIVFALYFPAAEAGQVGDYPGLYADWKQYNLVDYLNRRWSYLPGMYQLTQLVTWLWFSMFGTAPWAWHVLQLSLHAASAYLMGRLLYKMLSDAGFTGNAVLTALFASTLFAICPFAVEGVVWEPAYHYPQALALQLLILLCARNYLMSGKAPWAAYTALLFLLSIFTLEYFYLTPFFVILLIVLYRPVPTCVVASGKAASWLLMPQALIMALYFLLMRLTYGQLLPRAGGSEYLSQPGRWFVNPIRNALSLLLHTRFWPREWRSPIYRFFDTEAGNILSWALLLTGSAVLLFFFWKKRGFVRVGIFFGVVCLVSLLSSGPLQFDTEFRHGGDRYVYAAAALWSVILALVLMRLRPLVRGIAVFILLLINGILASLAIADWGASAEIVRKLERSLPSHPGKIVMLLNVPQVYKGIPMFAVGRESEFAIRRRQLSLPAVNSSDTIVEVAGYPMMDKDDGADAIFEDDSTVRVTMHDWGRWWMKGNLGAGDYERELFSVKEMSSSHHYLLRLKRPASSFVFYRQDGSSWYELKGQRGHSNRR